MRDRSAQTKNATPPVPHGRISGTVMAADNGRPIKRARVFASAAELLGERGMISGHVLDEDGDAMPGVNVRVIAGARRRLRDAVCRAQRRGAR